jgi:hypothetical protein
MTGGSSGSQNGPEELSSGEVEIELLSTPSTERHRVLHGRPPPNELDRFINQPIGPYHFSQFIPLLILVLAIFATILCVRSRQSGLALILWLLFIWLFPIVGSLVALLVLRKAWSQPFPSKIPP